MSESMRVVRDAIFMFVITFVSGASIGFAAGAVSPRMQLALGVQGLVTSLVGFAFTAASSRVRRFQHNLLVAAVCSVASLLNLALGASFLQWLVGVPTLLLVSALGAGLSLLFMRRADASDSAA